MATTPALTSTGTTGSQPLVGMESSLSNWVGPYVTNMLGKGQALASTPYQAYQGTLTAGPSALQSQAFQGLAGLTMPAGIGAAEQRSAQLGQQMGAMNYAPTTFSADQFTPAAAQQYMNPYLQASLDPQIAEARRQAEIQRVQQAGRMTQAGSFGGSRQAIMEAERQRNLGTQIGDITSKGLQSAYDRAMEQRLKESALGLESQRYGEQAQQFGAQQGMTAAQSAAQYGLAGLQQTEAARQFQEQQRARAAELGATLGLEAQRGTEASRQFGATYGLRSLADQLAAGKEQRAIAQQPLDFGYQQFEKSVAAPRESATYMSSLLQGLPVRANPYYGGTQGESAAASAISGGLGAYNLMNYFGNIGKKG